MQQKEFTITILTASQGCMLTQNGEVDIKERIVTHRVALGIHDSVDNWKEISADEGAELESQKRKAIDDAMEQRLTYNE